MDFLSVGECTGGGGIQHIITQRMAKDKMTRTEAEAFVLLLPQVIAHGRLHPDHITNRGEIGRNITAYQKTVGLSAWNGNGTPQVRILTAYEGTRSKSADTKFIKKQESEKRIADALAPVVQVRHHARQGDHQTRNAGFPRVAPGRNQKGNPR